MADYAHQDSRSVAAALRGNGDYRVPMWERYAQQFKPQDMERAMLSYPQYCAEQVRQWRLNAEVDQRIAAVFPWLKNYSAMPWRTCIRRRWKPGTLTSKRDAIFHAGK